LYIIVPTAVPTPALRPVVVVAPRPTPEELINLSPTVILVVDIEPVKVPVTLPVTLPVKFPVILVALKIPTVVIPERTTPVSLNVTVLNPLRFCI
jgi:hypothetical protein